MPAVGAAIAAALTKAAVMKFVATVALSLALGAYQQSQARRKARAQERAQRDAYNNSLKDRHVTVRSGVSTRQYVLGTVRVGGTLMHIEANGQDNTALDSVLALAGNKCELVGYYVGDEYVTPAQFPGEKYGNRKQVGKTHTHFVPQGTSTVSIDLGEEILADSVKPVNWFIGDRSPTSFGPVTVTGTTVEFECTSEKGGRILIIYKTYEAEKLRVIYKDGDPNQFTSGWDDVETPLWTLEDHRLRGVAYLRTLNLWDEDIYHSGAPQMGAVLKGGWVGGHRFFDPRTNTYPAYTANPALIAAWWMTLPRGRGGMGIPESWIDWPYVSMAANICDEWITVRKLDGDGYDSIRRYECHTLLDTANPPVDNLNIVMSSMAGEYVFTAGKYRIFAGAFRTATITITDDDVVGDKDIVMDKSGQDDAPANIVTSTFVNAARNWLESSPRPIRNERYISDDGAESPLDISLPATTDERHAAYLMGVMLESARPAFAGEITVLGVGEDISVLDTLRLQLSNRPQYEGRTFQVVNRIDNWDGTFKLTLQEIRPNIWQLDPDTFLPTDPTPVPDTSYLWDIAPVSGFAVSPQKPQSLTDGKATVRVDLSWGLHPQPYVREGGRIETRYRAPGGEWIWNPAVAGDALGTSFTAVLEDGITYQYQARAVSGLGATSNWTDGWDDYDGLIGAPPALTGLSTESLLSGINVFWTFPGTRNALRHTEIRFSVSDRFDDAALMGHFAWPTDRGTLLKLVPGAKFWFWGRLVDENGTPGPWHPSPDKPGVLGEASTDIDLIQGLITEEVVTGALGELLMADIEAIPSIKDTLSGIGVDVEGLRQDVDRHAVEIAEIPQIKGVLTELGIDVTGLEDEINALQAEVADIVGAPNWDSQTQYLEGQIVRRDGLLYRAIKNVPAGIQVSNTSYWEKIGNYDSIGQALAALLVRMSNVEVSLDDLTGELIAQSQEILALQSDLSTLGGTVSGQAQLLEGIKTSVSELDGVVTSEAARTSSIIASMREDDGQGQLDAALNEWDSRAWIQRTEKAVVDSQKAQATVNEQLGVQIGGNTAQIGSLSDTVAKLDQSTAIKFDQLDSTLGGLDGELAGQAGALDLIKTDVSRIDGAVTAQSTSISQLESGVADNKSAIQTVSQAVTDNKSAQAQVNQQLQSDLSSLDGTVSGQSQALEELETSVSEIGGVVTSESARTSSIIASLREDDGQGQLDAALNEWDSRAWIQRTEKAVVDNEKAQASINEDLGVQIWDNTAQIGSLSDVVASLDQSTAIKLDQLESTLGGLDGELAGQAGALDLLKTDVSRIDGAVTAQSTSISQLESGVADNKSAIQTVGQTVADNKSAQAQVNQRLESSVENATTAIQTVSETVANLDGDISATWGVQLQANQNGVKYISGFALGLTNESGETQSTCVVLADRFAVMHATNGDPVAVFSVQGGITIMNSALIGNASITSAKIADAAVTNAQIADAAITNAKIGAAAITSVKIGDAEIGTLKIAGSAITIHASISAPMHQPGSTATERPVSLQFYLPHAADFTLMANVEPYTVSGTSGTRDARSQIWYDNGGYVIGSVYSVRDVQAVLSSGGSTTIKGWLPAGNHSITMRQVPSFSNLSYGATFPPASMVILIAMR
ncbi:DUF1983 domain-containing protein (plasmid) [Delftia tsuruhatensis]